MASGIQFMFEISNSEKRGAEEAPIMYRIGRGWASGEKSDFVVAHTKGFAECGQYYKDLPGLRGWTFQALSGVQKVVEDGGKLLLVKAAKEAGQRSPVIVGLDINCTMDRYVRDCGFTEGHEICAQAGIDLHVKFLDVWTEFGLAVSNWVKRYDNYRPLNTAHLTVRWVNWGACVSSGDMTPEDQKQVLEMLRRFDKGEDKYSLCQEAWALYERLVG